MARFAMNIFSGEVSVFPTPSFPKNRIYNSHSIHSPFLAALMPRMSQKPKINCELCSPEFQPYLHMCRRVKIDKYTNTQLHKYTNISLWYIYIYIKTGKCQIILGSPYLNQISSVPKKYKYIYFLPLFSNFFSFIYFQTKYFWNFQSIFFWISSLFRNSFKYFFFSNFNSFLKFPGLLRIFSIFSRIFPP